MDLSTGFFRLVEVDIPGFNPASGLPDVAESLLSLDKSIVGKEGRLFLPVTLSRRERRLCRLPPNFRRSRQALSAFREV